MNQMNQKAMTKLLLIHWAGFNNELIEISGSTLFTGVNGSGKTTILDAMLYLLTGNTKFNSAAQDRERTVLSYVRGDTSSNGDDRYLRSGDIISYIAMEFYDMLEKIPFVIGVCIESPEDKMYIFCSLFFVFFIYNCTCIIHKDYIIQKTESKMSKKVLTLKSVYGNIRKYLVTNEKK